MGFLDFIKGSKKGDVPPDVGQEEEEIVETEEELEDSKGKPDKKSILAKLKRSAEKLSEPISSDEKVESNRSSVNDSVNSNIGVERINARFDEIVLREKQLDEKMSRLNESIGENRAMNLNNEKKIMESMKGAEKVIDIFNQLKPEELRLDYQKVDLRLKTLEEKNAANRQFVDSLMEEFTVIKKKSGAFLGTEGLIKMNEDIKKDLVQANKVAEETQMYADKAKQLFLELRTGFAESEKVAETVSNLNSAISVMKEEVEGLKIKHDNLVNRADYADFKKTFNNKISLFESIVPIVENLKKEINRIDGVVENSLDISKRNSEDIGDISLKVGSTNSKKLNDYENQLAEIVSVVETLVDQVSELKKGKKLVTPEFVKEISEPVNEITEPVKEVELVKEVAPIKKERREKFKGILKKKVKSKKKLKKKEIPKKELKKKVTVKLNKNLKEKLKPKKKGLKKSIKNKIFQDKKSLISSKKAIVKDTSKTGLLSMPRKVAETSETIPFETDDSEVKPSTTTLASIEKVESASPSFVEKTEAVEETEPIKEIPEPVEKVEPVEEAASTEEPASISESVDESKLPTINSPIPNFSDEKEEGGFMGKIKGWFRRE